MAPDAVSGRAVRTLPQALNFVRAGETPIAKVGLGKNGDGFGIIVEISADIPGVEPGTARALIEKAHQVCPYSKATRGNITVTPA